MLAGALALLLFDDGGVVQAQSARVLVSNIDQTPGVTQPMSSKNAVQVFETGVNDTGHAPSSIEPLLQAGLCTKSKKAMEAIALARHHLWLALEGFSLSAVDPDIQELPVALHHPLADPLVHTA